MKFRLPNIPSRFVWIGSILVTAIAGVAAAEYWVPPLRDGMNETISLFKENPAGDEGADAHAGHGGGGAHAGHDHNDPNMLELSPQARRNIGLTDDMIRGVQFSNYGQSITVPAVVVERPGKTRILIAAPMTGVVTGVYITKGETVLQQQAGVKSAAYSGQTLLFKLRLTHEDVVKAQTTYLETLGKLKIAQLEVVRLRNLSAGLAPARLREREYELRKHRIVKNAQRAGLLLHGLTDKQVTSIEENFEKNFAKNFEKIDAKKIVKFLKSNSVLIREIFVRVPVIDVDSSLRHHSTERPLRVDQPRIQATSSTKPTVTGTEIQPKPPVVREKPLVVQELSVRKGQLVQAGQTMCVLADYSELFIEGRAFERDAGGITMARDKGWKVTALRERIGRSPEMTEGLRIVYLDNEIDIKSRALKFYVRLKNTIVSQSGDYIDWKYKPGQRLQLQVPVQKWKKMLVLPVDAVAQDGVENYVFEQNGDHFKRKPVHVLFRDQFNVVISNDPGSRTIFERDIIAHAGAHQMQMALKNKASGGGGGHHGHMH
ncbi:MAG: efflux RND transporter periplasmic adaptor subunit [Planctomycetes bacterium]|nr:efflux RND transporter periplasmic adaptor subunit [Planctomycetota bacterium]